MSEPQSHWTENEKVVGVCIRDMIDLYTNSQAHFRAFDGSGKFPRITDEQLRAFVAPSCPFQRTQIKLYRLLTRRTTGQSQFKDLLRVHRETAEKMISESAS